MTRSDTAPERPADRALAFLVVLTISVSAIGGRCPFTYLGNPSWPQATLAWWPFQSSEHMVLQVAAVNTWSTPF